jgi:plasmid stabilization system protein ParE
MRVRYTATARREFNQTVDYLLDHAPSVAAAFADSVEQAIAELVDHPYSAQATDQPGVRRKYIRRFRHAKLQHASIVFGHVCRHGRACPGHPRLACRPKDVDARNKCGHDDEARRAKHALIRLCAPRIQTGCSFS